MMPSSPPVVMRDVVQKFGSTTVLHGLDLTVNPGEDCCSFRAEWCGEKYCGRYYFGFD